MQHLAASLALLILAASFPNHLQAQTIDDGVMMSRGALFTGNIYTHDSWDHYWEGDLKRDNGNIGTLTTKTSTWFGNYGLTDRLNLIASVPYVWTRASQGVLHSMQGLQDITVAGKYSFFERPSTKAGSLRAIAVGSAGLPMTDYTPDFQPLSIGSASKRVSGRFAIDLHTNPGWFVSGSTAYTWRGVVTLDRPYYFTNNQFFMTNEVEMPGVFDYVVRAGYRKRHSTAMFSFAQQKTQGGGDIRRQDMPFVSNRMNFSRAGALVMHPIPKLRDLFVQYSLAYTLQGRNVGQATTITAGVFYRFHFLGRPTR